MTTIPALPTQETDAVTWDMTAPCGGTFRGRNGRLQTSAACTVLPRLSAAVEALRNIQGLDTTEEAVPLRAALIPTATNAQRRRALWIWASLQATTDRLYDEDRGAYWAQRDALEAVLRGLAWDVHGPARARLGERLTAAYAELVHLGEGWVPPYLVDHLPDAEWPATVDAAVRTDLAGWLDEAMDAVARLLTEVSGHGRGRCATCGRGGAA